MYQFVDSKVVAKVCSTLQMYFLVQVPKKIYIILDTSGLQMLNINSIGINHVLS